MSWELVSFLILAGVILSLARMADIGTPDPASGSIEVGAGLEERHHVQRQRPRPHGQSGQRPHGDEVAGRVGQVWGIDDDGELAGLWKRSGQPGLWFNAGSLAQNRVFSRFLALQIKAVDEGLIDPAPPRPPTG